MKHPYEYISIDGNLVRDYVYDSILQYCKLPVDSAKTDILLDEYRMSNDIKLSKSIELAGCNECLAAIYVNPMNLALVKYQTEFLCLEAVKLNGLALQFVRTQTDAICLQSVKNHYMGLQWVKKQTDEICLAAVSENGYALQYVKNQTNEICMAALYSEPRSFSMILEQENYIELALELDSYNIRFVKNRTPMMCMALLDMDPLAIMHINRPPPELCLYAIRKDLRAIGSVHFRCIPEGPVKVELAKWLMQAILKYGEQLQNSEDCWFIPGLKHVLGYMA